MAEKKIAVICGSTRKKRIGLQVTKFVMSVLETQLAPVDGTSFSIHLVDIEAFNLPLFDEEVHPATVPAMAQFQHEHSLKWSAEIAKYDGYVIVTACYNGGTPGAIKNAIDYLYNEWIGKPIYIISYGIQGGKTAAESLKITFNIMKLRVVATMPALRFPGDIIPAYGVPMTAVQAMSGQLAEESLASWADQKDEISKGFGELKEMLMAPPEKA